MLAEIREQPEVVRRVLQREWEAGQMLAEAVRREGVRYTLVAARGTSDNAARLLKYLFEIEIGMPVALAAPSVVTLYHAPLDLKRCLVIGISQSGEAPDVIEYLSYARSVGAITASITNDPTAPLARTSDYPLCLHAGLEQSVAATKTYAGTLGVIYLLMALLKGCRRTQEALQAIPDQMEEALTLEEQIAPSVERYRYMQECLVLARGLNLATAEEVALKFIETCYVMAEPYSVADFMHGPFALVEEGFPCFLFAPEGVTFPSLLEAATRLHQGKAEMIIFAHDPQILGLARTPIQLPSQIEETFSPLVYVIVGQLFAYHLALARDLDPDHPRGLQKITRTR